MPGGNINDYSFCVVGHHSRKLYALELAQFLDAHLLLDDGSRGANWNHHRAIQWASKQNKRVIILEDDAVLVPGFTALVSDWLHRFPSQLISFYLGTGRPPQYQLVIASKLIEADKVQADFITLDRLVHAVCYSIPQPMIETVLNKWNIKKAADYAIGDGCTGMVIYPCYSLVDHDDGDTVEQHPDGRKRTERRKAWRLA